MNKHILSVFVILLSAVTIPTSLKAAVAEEYKSIEEISQDQLQVEQPEETETPVVKKKAELPQNIHINIHTASQAKEEKVANNALAAAPTGDVVIEAESASPSKPSGIGITPMVGGIAYGGPWAANTRGQYNFGLALEVPISTFFAFEAEAGFGNTKLSYTNQANQVIMYDFNHLLLGGNGKIYFMKTRFRPYIGGGLVGMGSTGLERSVVVAGPGGVPALGRMPYNPIIGYANLMAGVDLALTDSISVGARGAVMLPAINRPMTAVDIDWRTAAPGSPVGFEEPNLLNSNVYRLMGTMTIKL